MAATDYDFETSRSNIIKAALRKVGGIYEGQSVSAYQDENAVESLNQLVKAWQNRNVFLWTERTFEVTLATGVKRYALEDDPTFLSIDKAYYRKTNDDTRIERMSWADYQDIEDKDNTGEPLVITIDPDPTDNEIVVWPVPTAAENGNKLYCIGTVKLQDFDTAAESADVFSNWELALVYALATELAPEYGVSNAEQDRLARRANTLFAEAKLGGKKQITSDSTFVTSAFRHRR